MIEGNPPPAQSLGQNKAQITRIVESNTNSLEELILVHNCPNLQQCLALAIRHYEQKRKDIEVLAKISTSILDKFIDCWRDHERAVAESLQREEQMQKYEKENVHLVEINENLKEQLKDALDRLQKTESMFESEKVNLNEEINRALEEYLDQLERTEGEKFQNLNHQIKKLEESLFHYQELQRENEEVMANLQSEKEDLNIMTKILQKQSEKMKEQNLILNNQLQKLKSDNELLCLQIRQFYSKKSSSTYELASCGSSNNLLFCQYPLLQECQKNESQEEHELEHDKGKEIQSKNDNQIYKVKSLKRLSSAASFMNLADLNFEGIKCSFTQNKVSIGTETDFTLQFPEPQLSPIKSLSYSRINPLSNSIVIDKIDAKILRDRMTKKKKMLDNSLIPQYEAPSTERSFLSSLVNRRTHKPKLSESIIEIQERRNKNYLSSLNNSIKDRLVSSRIRRKKNQSLQQEAGTNSSTQHSLLESFYNLAIKSRIKK